MNGTHQHICIHCGLCCDGTLFHHAKIKDNEPIAPGYVFEIIFGEKRAFKQPCPYFYDHVCGIYDHRPYSCCVSFRCKLLQSVISEKVSYTEAIKTIDEVITHRTKVELNIMKHHPENTGVSITQKMKAFEKHFTGMMDEVEFRKKFGRLLLDIFILKKKLSDSFRKSTTK